MNKAMQKLLKQINDKKNEVKSLVNEEKLDQAREAKKQLKELQDKFDLLYDLDMEEREGIENKVKEGTANQISGEEKPDKKKLVKAFVNIVKAGFLGTKVREEDEKVYKDALTSDATPNDDGEMGIGVTIPDDIRYDIISLRRSDDNLEQYVNNEGVTTKTGSRNIEADAESVPFDNVEEAADFPEIDEPVFRQIKYSIKKKGGILKMTAELFEDTAVNIMAYINKWIAKKTKATRNAMILKVLNEMTKGKEVVQKVNKELKEHKLTAFENGCKAAGEKIENFGKKMSVVSGGIAAFGAAVGKNALDTENDLMAMQGQLGLTAQETENLKTVAKNLYTNGYGEGLGDCSSALVTLIQNIKGAKEMTVEQQQAIAEQMMTMSEVFETENEELARTLTTMLNNGIIDDISEGMDILTIGFQNGANYSGELLDTMREYSPKFKELGLDAETAMAYLIQGAQNGAFNLDKVGDAMKEFSIRAVDGSETTIDGFQKIGLNADEMSKKFAAGGETASQAFHETLVALKNMDDPIAQNTAGVELFGTMWEDLGKDVVLSLADVEGGLKNVEGATTKAGEQINNSFSTEVKSVFRDLQTSLLPLGNELLRIGKDVMPTVKNVVGEITDALKNMDSQTAQNIIKIGAVVAAIGPALTVAGQVVGTVGKVAGVVKNASSIIGALTSPVGLAVAAIAGLVAAGVWLHQNWDNIKEWATETWQKVTESWENIKTSVSEKVESMKQTVSEKVKSIKTSMSDGWESTKTTVSEKVESIKGTISEKFQAAKETVSNIFDSIKETASGAWETVKNIVQVAVMAIGEILSAAFQVITLPWRFIWENCKTLITSAWESIKTTVSQKLEAIKTVISTVWNTISAIISPIIDTIKNNISAGWEYIKTSVSTILDAIKTYVSTGWNMVKDTVSTVTDAIKTYVSTGWNMVKDTVSTVLNAIKSVVTTVWNAIKSAITTVLNAIKSVVTSVWNGIKSTVSSVMNAIKSVFTTAWNAIKSTVSGAVNGVKSAISSGLNAAKSTVSSILEGIKSKFSSVFENVKNVVRNAINTVKGYFNFSWSLPRIKLPHFSISGKFSLNPPSVPHFSIAWYKSGAIMGGPMIFGMNGNTLLAGGEPETGGEAILPLAPFYTKLNDILDKKLAAIKQIQNVYVESHTYIDGEEISSRTVSKVDEKMVRNKRKGR